MYYGRVDVSKGIDVAKSNAANSKECRICHCWFFNHGFEFQGSVCNDCHDLMMLCLNFSDISIITAKNVIIVIHDISKSDATDLLENSVLDDCWKKMHTNKIKVKIEVCNYYFDNLIKTKKMRK